jgi:hypothetical protein
MQLRSAADDAFHTGNFASTEWVTLASVEKLLARGGEGDVAPAEAAVDRLAAALPQASGTHAALEVLRLRALVARARGDKPTYPRTRRALPRHGGTVWLERKYGVGRGDAMTRSDPRAVLASRNRRHTRVSIVSPSSVPPTTHAMHPGGQAPWFNARRPDVRGWPTTIWPNWPKGPRRTRRSRY